ncbi:unnamed protein product [Enterobius vermicularis]|uniref:protein-tyrosine-phosphatase n=1 Tax=Enterobius vermicularis TaxID=51028 RepID=A0A0N4VCL5_ENTVE|nr:unnamed protein product [Enterobius vermicularis]
MISYMENEGDEKNDSSIYESGEAKNDLATLEQAKCSRSQQRLPGELHVDYSLESVLNPQVPSTAFQSISSKVLAGLLGSLSEKEFNRKFILVDCRYPFEYAGGHIKGAVNLHNPNDIGNVFFPNETKRFSVISKKIPIFYCEFSQKRGPTMAHRLRAYDRARNEARYPEVDYEEIYLLDRGYNNFFNEFQCRCFCEPSEYVKMVDSRHSKELRKYVLHRARTAKLHPKNPSQSTSQPRRCRLRRTNFFSSRSFPSLDFCLSPTEQKEKREAAGESESGSK